MATPHSSHPDTTFNGPNSNKVFKPRPSASMRKDHLEVVKERVAVPCEFHATGVLPGSRRGLVLMVMVISVLRGDKVEILCLVTKECATGLRVADPLILNEEQDFVAATKKAMELILDKHFHHIDSHHKPNETDLSAVDAISRLREKLIKARGEIRKAQDPDQIKVIVKGWYSGDIILDKREVYKMHLREWAIFSSRMCRMTSRAIRGRAPASLRE